MTSDKTLKWGETPFDSLSRDELLLLVKKMYAFVTNGRSCLSIQRAVDPSSAYWGRSGSGGIAIAMADQIIDSVEAGFDSENVYRSFYRYARDLLFDSSEFDIGAGWVVCVECGTMIGDSTERTSVCIDCGGQTRAIEWGDLEP